MLDGDVAVGVSRSSSARSAGAGTRQIAQNAGQEGSVIVRDVIAHRGCGRLQRRDRRHMEDLVKAGVIDPAKVTKTALQNAASIAGLMLTTEALISEIKEDKPDMPGMPPGGMEGMGGMM